MNSMNEWKTLESFQMNGQIEKINQMLVTFGGKRPMHA